MKQEIGPGIIIGAVVVLVILLGVAGWWMFGSHPASGTAAPGQNPAIPKEVNGHPVPPNAPVYFPVQGSGPNATMAPPNQVGGEQTGAPQAR